VPRVTRATSDFGAPAFTERKAMEFPKDQPGLILDVRIMLAHFSLSSIISLPKAAGEPESTVFPSSARRPWKVGSATMRLISPLSLSMI
jgi:hypothetical protein